MTSGDGGLLTINANVHHPLGTSKIASVEVLLSGQPAGFGLLPEGNDGQYSLTIEVPAGLLPPGQFLLELVARDTEGRLSDVWPYLTVSQD